MLFARLSKTNPRVNVVRAFEDGDYVFGHTEYDFASRRIGFEVFRFEDDLVVEHWDNIQERQGPNPSGRSMVDGPTEATDLDRTESNRVIVRTFVQEVLIDRRLDRIERYVGGGSYIQHDPHLADGSAALRSALEESSGDGTIEYQRLHRVLAEGSFVPSVSEGALGGVHTAFYERRRSAVGEPGS